MPDVDAFSQGLVKKYISGGRQPVDEFSQRLIDHALTQLPSEDLPVTSSGEALPDWDVGRHFVDAATSGRATGSHDSTAVARAKAEWTQAHPGEAWNAAVAGKVLPAVLAATALGRGARALSPELGAALTGAGGGAWPLRALSGIVSGTWQSATPALYDPEMRENLERNMLTGGAIGGAISVLAAPLRSSISPEIAELARRYMAQGVPLRTANIPGSPPAARIMAKVLGMAHPDLQALTRRIMAATGSNAELMNNETTSAALDAAGDRLNQSAQRIPYHIGDSTLSDEFRATAQQAHEGLAGQPEKYRQMAAVAGPIYRAIQQGNLDGTVYQNLTQRGSALSNAQRDPLLGQYANQFRTSLDDALERNAGDEAANIRLARNQYRNAIIADKLKDNETGIANPAKLFSLVKQNYGGTGEASETAANAGNPVDIGTLAGGASQFSRNLSAGPHITPGTGMGIGILAGEHGGNFLSGLAENHPILASGLGALTLPYSLGGALLNTETGTNMLLRGGPGFVANPIIPFASAARNYNPEFSPKTAETEAYIRQAAGARGIDPDVAVKVARSEGLGGAYAGDEGSSFGPFQLHYGGMPGTSKGNAVPGLGDAFTKATGLHASDPATTRAQIDFALDHALRNGWGAWHGWSGDANAGLPGSDAGTRIVVPLNPANIDPSGANALTGSQ
jgi:hypothetical protein